MIHKKNKRYHGKVVKVFRSGKIAITNPNPVDWDLLGKVGKVKYTWQELREMGYIFPVCSKLPEGYKKIIPLIVFMPPQEVATYENYAGYIRALELQAKRANREARQRHLDRSKRGKLVLARRDHKKHKI